MPRGRVKQFTDEELKERRQAREKEYYQKNREKVLARIQKRYYTNLGLPVPVPKPKLSPEQKESNRLLSSRARSKRYREKDSKKIDQRQWANRKTRSQTDINVSFKLMLSNARNRAGKVNREFDIDLEFINLMWVKQQGLCNISKIPMTFGIGTPNKVSIDRIDSAIGYTRDNCQLVITPINTAKLTLSQEEFIKMCKAVANNN